MSKKDFSGGLGSLLGEDPGIKEKENPARRIREEPPRGGGLRTTVILNPALLEKIRALAYWERITIKEVISGALEESIKRYEETKGQIKPISKRVKP